MCFATTGPQTFTEMFLILLEDRFPWLGGDEPASGSDTVDQLTELHETLKGTQNRQRRRTGQDRAV